MVDHVVDRMLVLRAASIIAVAAQPLIPAGSYDQFSGESGEPVFTPESTLGAVQAVRYLVKSWAAAERFAIRQGADPQEFRDARHVVSRMSHVMAKHVLVTRADGVMKVDAPSCAFHTALVAVRYLSLVPDDDPSAGAALSNAIGHCRDAGIDVSGPVGKILGVSPEAWPVFVRLLLDGKTLAHSIEAASLLSTARAF